MLKWGTKQTVSKYIQESTRGTTLELLNKILFQKMSIKKNNILTSAGRVPVNRSSAILVIFCMTLCASTAPFSKERKRAARQEARFSALCHQRVKKKRRKENV